MKRKWLLYYFLFTLVTIGIRSYFPLLQAPLVEDFFNITGIMALLAYLVSKRGGKYQVK